MRCHLATVGEVPVPGLTFAAPPSESGLGRVAQTLACHYHHDNHIIIIIIITIATCLSPGHRTRSGCPDGGNRTAGSPSFGTQKQRGRKCRTSNIIIITIIIIISICHTFLPMTRVLHSQPP